MSPRLFALALVAATAAACASDTPSSGPDAGAAPADSGAAVADGGAVEDAGTVVEDAGLVEADSGAGAPDADPPTDAGPPLITPEVARAKLEAISPNRIQLWVVNHIRANAFTSPAGVVDEAALIADALANSQAIVDGGGDMIILINAPAPLDVFERVITAVRDRYPTFPLGISALDYGPLNLTEGFRLAARFDAQMVWCEVAPGEAIEYEVSGGRYVPADVTPVELALETQAQLKPTAMHTAGVHMKYTRNTDGHTFEESMRLTLGTMDGFNITGPATGVLADVERVRIARELAGTFPVGLASGVTNQNLPSIAQYIDYAIVGTALKADRNPLLIDEAKVRSMRMVMNGLGGGPR